MFCPQCKAEYRPGFTRCSDCGVDLVDELRSAHETPQEGEALRVIWKGDSEATCVSVCQELKNANIMYKVAQIPEFLDLRMAMNERYEVAVRSKDYARAREVVADDPDWEDEPLQDLHDSQPDSAIPHEEASSDSYLKRWSPQDASVQIWTQSPTDNISSMLEMSLKENFIRFRSERQQDGSRKFFVVPEDEYKAREIVREIEESTPPR